MTLRIQMVALVVISIGACSAAAPLPQDAYAMARAIMLQVHDEVTYKDDPDDYWQAPEETESLGTGDCEDFAILLMARLKELDIDSSLVGAYSRKRAGAHAVVALRGEETTGPWYDPTYGGTTSMIDDRYLVFSWLTYDEVLAKLQLQHALKGEDRNES